MLAQPVPLGARLGEHDVRRVIHPEPGAEDGVEDRHDLGADVETIQTPCSVLREPPMKIRSGA